MFSPRPQRALAELSDKLLVELCAELEDELLTELLGGLFAKLRRFLMGMLFTTLWVELPFLSSTRTLLGVLFITSVEKALYRALDASSWACSSSRS